MTEKNKTMILTVCPSCQKKYKVLAALIGKKLTCKSCSDVFEIKSRKSSPQIPDICRVAMFEKMVTKEQVEYAMCSFQLLGKAGSSISFDDFFVMCGLVSDEQMGILNERIESLKVRQLDNRFCTIAIKNRFITQEEADDALEKQARQFKDHQTMELIGDILVNDGAMTQEQQERVLASQKRMSAVFVSQDESQDESRDESQDESQDESPDSAPAVDCEGNTNFDSSCYPEPSSPSNPPSSPEPSSPPKPPSSPESSSPSKPPSSPESSSPSKPPSSPESSSPSKPPSSPEPSPPSKPPSSPEPSPPSKPPSSPESSSPSKPPSAPVPPSPSEPPFSSASKENKDCDKSRFDNTGDSGKILPAFRIQVAGDGLKALLQINRITDKIVTLDMVRSEMNAAKIAYGVVDDGVIELFLRKVSKKILLNKRAALNSEHPKDNGASKNDDAGIKKEEDPFFELVIARGLPAKSGKDAVVDYFFDTDYLKIGAKKKDGSIDFMDRGEIPFVSAGDLLAEKTPVEWPTQGVDVHGLPIEAQAVSDIPIRCGKGAAFSEDKLKVVAKAAGEPRVTYDGMISVLMEHKIAGNIGLKTGHVDFEGNIIVSDTVRSGFRVKCATLKAATIESADIETTGDVLVTGGITGATIRSQGRVVAKYIIKSDISAYGDVVAEKEILDSTIQTSGSCITKNGSMISSEIASKQGIESREIGTETSSPCILRVGGDDHLEKELASIRDETEACRERMEESVKNANQLKKENRELAEKIVAFAHVQDRGQLEISELKRKLDLLAFSGQTAKGKESLDKRNILNSMDAVSENMKSAENVEADNAKHGSAESQIVYEIQKLNEKIQKASHDLEILFKREEAIQEELEAADRSYNDAKENIEVLKYKKKMILKTFRKNKGAAIIKARKAILPGTVITGNHTRKVVESRLGGVVLKETRLPQKDGEPEEWEFSVHKK
ncbi:hypothetical protein MTBBW1_2030016 [Desulfamplus magnetovallimortis]|uniref:Flagellar Assembly Protein A N-terminal region domain-containing protein n=1 Tax=Desulfamplus magnetovallimortis TaxID=1246637 RepID=A0A1W1HBV9_9BACT|nr:FapA family protein [Desulfamplus magnetovallimortis]SLM29926.1 hypothetical protein MTBBW1_2030016 [Desulfamplus magnetovallimortis]